jgi:hypothetical protein
LGTRKILHYSLNYSTAFGGAKGDKEKGGGGEGGKEMSF